MRLVKAALSFAAERGLGHAETRLLIFMSMKAVDSDAEPRYWAGRDVSAVALGAVPERIRDEWNANPSRKRDLDLTEAAELARARVQTAVRRLIEAGAIERASGGYRGSTTVYRLIHEGKGFIHPFFSVGVDETTPIPDSPANPAGENPKGVDLNHERGGSQPRKGWMETTPEEDEDQEEGKSPPYPPRQIDLPSRADEQPPESGDRITDDWLQSPIVVQPAPWYADLPEPTTSAEAARCERHPRGTTEPCGSCMTNRRTWDAAHRTNSRARRPARELVVRNGREVCANNADHLVLKDGTCKFCMIRAIDLAALLMGAPA
ncbi:hypothetical protein [Microbacterium sp. CJ88]|uniref:hypothetical protein n=1 Tax=Microbacterium sp. CJ88 TaxID=3445672 RepID=UPI003F65FCAF